jgi:hypothetical protein
MKKPKKLPSPYKFADGGPLHDRDINGKLLQSTYASALGNMFREGGPFGEDQGVFDYATSIYASQPGNYYRTGGQFPRPYSLPEDSFKQGGTNLHNSVYASSSAPYPGIYANGGPIIPTIATYNPTLSSTYAKDYTARLKDIKSNPIDPKTGAPYQGSGGTDAGSTGTGGNYRAINPQEKAAKIAELESLNINQLRPDLLEQYLNLKNNKPYFVAAERSDKFMYEPYDLRTYTPMNAAQLATAYPEPEPPKPTIGYATDPYTGKIVPGVSNVQNDATFQVNRQMSQFAEAAYNTPEATAKRAAIDSERLNNIELLKTMTPEQKAAMRAAGLTPAQYLADPFSAGATKFAEGGMLGGPGDPIKTQFGRTVSLTDQNEYNKRLQYYNLSKNLQNYINTEEGRVPNKYRGWVSNDDVLKGYNLQWKGWYPDIYSGTKGDMTIPGYFSMMKYRKDPNFYYDIQPDAWYHVGAKKGNLEDVRQWGVPTLYPYWFKPVLEREPLPEIGKLPTKKLPQIQTEIIPTNYNYIPQKYEPIQVANRSQTIMEADPDREGKYRMKEMRQVPYSANFPGEGWQPANAPRVLYIDSKGNEVEERPKELKQLDLQGVTFENGGSILSMSNTPQLEGEGKDLTYPDGAYVYNYGGKLFAPGGPIYPTNQQLAQFLNPEYQRVTQGQEVTVRPNAYQLQQAKNKAAGINKYDAINIKPQVAESTKPNIAPVDKKVLDKAIAQKTAERKVVAKEIKNSPLLTQEQKQEILMSPQKLDENVHLAYQKEPDVLKEAKEYTAADKATNILRNPLVAASYFMKPGAFNMPMNYSELERSPNYSDETWNRNAAGQGLNAASYLHPAGLALHMADNALYTATDLDKALESGKTEDWKKAGLSAASTILDLVGSRYIGGSGRLLNAGEQATLNAMNTSNRLGLNPSVNNFLGTRVFPNINSSVVRSADDIAAARLIPQINPNNINYNPLARNLYNNAVTAGHVQNILEATNASKSIIPSIQTPYIDEVIGSFKNKNRTAQLKEAEDWTNSWVQHPATQEKILNSYKKALEGKTLTSTEKYNLGEAMGYSANYNAQNRLGEYPLLGQGLGRRNIHSDNAGVSYTHYELPGQILPEPTNTFNSSKNFKDLIKELDPMEIENLGVQTDPNYGNWISRTLGEEQRISTGVHELSHDWVKDYVLKNTELSKELTSGLDDFRIQEIIDKYKGTKLEDKVLKELEYFEDPTELFARLMESRRYFNISPGQKVTPKQVGEYLDLISAGKTPIDHVFGKIISRGKKGVDFFNNPWLWTGVGIGGTGLGNELLQNNGSDQNSSGQFKMGGQARVSKYPNNSYIYRLGGYYK